MESVRFLPPQKARWKLCFSFMHCPSLIISYNHKCPYFIYNLCDCLHNNSETKRYIMKQTQPGVIEKERGNKLRFDMIHSDTSLPVVSLRYSVNYSRGDEKMFDDPEIYENVNVISTLSAFKYQPTNTHSFTNKHSQCNRIVKSTFIHVFGAHNSNIVLSFENVTN